MVDPVIMGTIALDSLETPFGKVQNVLGGSASYASIAASFFSKPGVLSIVGKDFPCEHIKFLNERGIDTKGIALGEKTFRWQGFYEFDMNEAKTLRTELNALESYKVEVPEEYRNAKYVFLANIDPELQLAALAKIKKPELVVMDTMNFWIEKKFDSLKKTLEKVDIVIINEAELRELAGEPNLVKAAQKVLSWGPKRLIAKRGEYGALMFSDSTVFSAPAFPLESVFDPTGAGDSFAGGFMGYISNANNTDESAVRQAIIFGSAMASFNVEDFSLNRLKNLSYKEIEDRFREFKSLTHFDDL